MELQDHDFLEELISLRRETWDTNPSSQENQLFSNGWSFDCFEYQNYHQAFPPNSFSCQQVPQSYNNNGYTYNEIYSSLLHEFSAPQVIDSSSYNTLDTPPFLAQEDYPLSMMEEEDPGFLGEELHCLDLQTTCKIEPSHSLEMPIFNTTSSCVERKNRTKKLQGQPSKNLMAERRRRKRLNDRLSMLRSIVPKISKMDRTAILGDTIDYMKELLAKINNLKQEIEVDSNMAGIFKDVKPNEIIVRNSPSVLFKFVEFEFLSGATLKLVHEFDVERRNVNTRVEICCAGKPGLLLATVNTLETLGVEIQQCVISCFNDFTVQASCSEELQQKTILSSEDIKQALFRSAGYGGRYL